MKLKTKKIIAREGLIILGIAFIVIVTRAGAFFYKEANISVDHLERTGSSGFIPDEPEGLNGFIPDENQPSKKLIRLDELPPEDELPIYNFFVALSDILVLIYPVYLLICFISWAIQVLLAKKERDRLSTPNPVPVKNPETRQPGGIEKPVDNQKASLSHDTNKKETLQKKEIDIKSAKNLVLMGMWACIILAVGEVIKPILMLNISAAYGVTSEYAIRFHNMSREDWITFVIGKSVIVIIWSLLAWGFYRFSRVGGIVALTLFGVLFLGNIMTGKSISWLLPIIAIMLVQGVRGTFSRTR